MKTESKMQIWQLRQMQSLPLKIKILKTQQRIREWVGHFGLDGVFVSFSGGKDSTVLLHLAREIYPEMVGVFSDTGLEFPEIRDYVKTIDNIVWLKPKLNFRQVIEKYGYPVVSKEQSEWISRVRSSNKSSVINKSIFGILPNGGKTQYKISEQWRYLINAPFKIGSQCCNEMKKKPMNKYSKETGRVAFVGTMAGESRLRTQKWLQNGCNAFDNAKPISAPLSFWLEEDIWEYIKVKGIDYCPIYDKGYQRTGCIFCMFGAHLEKEPTRFQLLQKTHPKLWRYCLKDTEKGGLGLREVLEYVGIPYESFLLEDER